MSVSSNQRAFGKSLPAYLEGIERRSSRRNVYNGFELPAYLEGIERVQRTINRIEDIWLPAYLEGIESAIAATLAGPTSHVASLPRRD